MASDGSLTRQHTNDIEIGLSDAIQKHITRHVVPPRPISQRRLNFEHKRPRILREMIAEAAGCFFYVYPGIAAVATFTLAATSGSGKENNVAAFGSMFTIGLAFAFGVAFAVIICAPISGGHFNPAMTLCFAIWQGFPWRKVPHYIISQIFGAFLAGCLLMGCYWPEIQAARAVNMQTNGTVHFNGGVASILCAYPNANQTNQGFLFLQEFFIDCFLAMVIWACLDPTNPFVSPVSAPFTIGLAYAVIVWGFAANTISTNLARDLGTRLVSLAFFGKGAFTIDNGYPWISILVNIPASILSTAFYEFVIRDSLTHISKGHAEHEDGEEGLQKHFSHVVRDPYLLSTVKSQESAQLPMHHSGMSPAGMASTHSTTHPMGANGASTLGHAVTEKDFGKWDDGVNQHAEMV